MSRIHLHSITALTCLFWLATAGCAWGLFLDRQPPIDILRGQVVAYDRNTHVMLIEWAAIRHRHCAGTRSGWIRDDGEEPPPHIVVPLPEVTLPPKGFRGPSPQPGSIVHWRTAIEVPPYLQGDLIYRAQWDFSCNPVQSLFPLRIDSPFITVRQDG